jgi:RNase H-fold protein (predicted Holliday junction resolvase)
MLSHALRAAATAPTAAALMALDVSDTTIGVAVSDLSRSFSKPLTVFRRHGSDRQPLAPAAVARKLQTVVHEHGVCGAVLGWPKVSAINSCTTTENEFNILHRQQIIIDQASSIVGTM